MSAHELGVVGLGRIGGGLALQALQKGMRVSGFTLGGAAPELLKAGLQEVGELSGFRDALAAPRRVFLYIPAGPGVDDLLDRLAAALEPGDILVDGGNSYWGDSVRRHSRLRERGIHLVDVGTSGGVDGARHGACFMAGGEPEPVALLEPILTALAVPGGYVHAGPPGAGHFAKLVHNGIEFGMLQAIGEGIDLLERHPVGLDVQEILRCWRHGSVIRSWLVDLMEQAYRAENGLERIPSYVEDTGEVNWLVADALLPGECGVRDVGGADAIEIVETLCRRERLGRLATMRDLLAADNEVGLVVGIDRHPHGRVEAKNQARRDMK